MSPEYKGGEAVSFLDKVARLDSAMQRGLDNSFAFIFGGRVVPAEIEELLKQETEDNLVHTYEGDIEAPNVFEVFVSPKDNQNLMAHHPKLPTEFADQLTRFQRNQGWVTPGLVSVVISEDASLRTGQLRARSELDENAAESSHFRSADSLPDQPQHEGLAALVEAKDYRRNEHDDPHTGSAMEFSAKELSASELPFVDRPPVVPEESVATEVGDRDESVGDFGVASQSKEEDMKDDSGWPSTEHIPVPVAAAEPEEAALPGEQPQVQLMLLDGSSRTYEVQLGSNILGRSAQADFRLPDSGVSRQHAEIVWNGEEAFVVDLQSTNGTTVNDTKIDNWMLADGDVITIGHSHIQVRIRT